MRHWEYCTALLYAVAVSFTKTKGWRLKEINEQEQQDWKKTEVYATLAEFCNHMDEQGWELTCVAYPDHTVAQVVLYFKRSL